ncbi:MAG: N-6 DNA methylase, partial [Candidatus Hydrothermarchaeales archaeon]
MDTPEEKFAAELKGLAYVFNDLTSRGKLENEEDVKSAVIERFLKIAGWDVSNPDEIKKELPVEGGKVDYALKVEGEIKLIIEAKALEKDLEKGFDQTKGKGKRTYEEQAINYAYNNGVKWVLLTNGREWRLYNAYWEGTNKDRLAFIINIDEFEAKAGKLALFRRQSVIENQLDIKLKLRPLRKPVDEEVAEFLLISRKALTESVYKNNKDKYDIDMLREGIQRILDRLVFFKICEDRDILEFGRLRDTFEFFKDKMLSKDSFVQGLKLFFRDFDNIYNGEMFAPHPSEDFVVTNEVYEKIITGLYEYDFATINVDILGRIYENYLGNTLQEMEKRGVEWITAPQERKKYGQYYTPQYVVDYIISNVGLTKDSRVLDAACGSGAFLIKAYDRLKELYGVYNEEQRKKASNNTIATDIKMIENINSEILKQNLFGVDLNPEAVELTKINLWLRSIQKDTKLNNLDANIKCGNSLISGTEGELEEYFENPAEKRPLDWNKEFKEVMNKSGFDVVIGNPPYVQMQRMAEEQKYCETYYPEIYAGQNDLLYYFVLKGLQALRNDGTLGYITSRYF